MDIGTFPIGKCQYLMRGPKWRPRNSAYGIWIISFKWLRISFHTMMYAQNIVITITNFGFFRPTTKCGSPASVVVESDTDLLWTKRPWSGSSAYAESKLCAHLDDGNDRAILV